MDCSKYVWPLRTKSHVHKSYLWNIMMVVSQVVFSGIILGLRVDWLVISMSWLADSFSMMQSWRHYWEVKNLQQCAWLLATPTISYLAGQHTVKLRLRRITCAADDNAICKYDGICKLRLSAVRLPCGSPRSSKGQDLSMWCLRD